MIEDQYERTRAILWMLADLDPGMPLLSALGHMKAIEQRVAAMEVAAVPAKKKVTPSTGRYIGGAGVVNLVRDFSGSDLVRSAAKRGDRAAVATALSGLTGCGPAEAIQAAETLVSTMMTT